MPAKKQTGSPKGLNASDLKPLTWQSILIGLGVAVGAYFIEVSNTYDFGEGTEIVVVAVPILLNVIRRAITNYAK